MARGNGKSEVDPQDLDAEHELPPADGSEDSPQAAAEVSFRRKHRTAEAEAERDTLLDRLARMQAEFENARKRAAREQQEFANTPWRMRSRRCCRCWTALTAPCKPHSGEKSELRGGVELIYKQLHDALGKLGLRTIPAKGEPFDPRWHEAIEMVDTTEAEDHRDDR